MSAQLLEINEYDAFCSSCGSWDKYIVESFGWCRDCIKRHRPDVRLCKACDAEIEHNVVGNYCSYHKLNHWYSRNADLVEDYIAKGFSLYRASKQVAEDIRPKCICCGQPIKGGKTNAIFCKQTQQCRSAARRYRTLQESYGLSKQIALEQVQRELALVT